METRVIDGPPEAFAFAVPDGRAVLRAGEVTLGRGALEALGVRDRRHGHAGRRRTGLPRPRRRPSRRDERRRPRRRHAGRHPPRDVAAAAHLDPASRSGRRPSACRCGDRAAGGGAAAGRPAGRGGRGQPGARDRLRRHGAAARHRRRQPAHHADALRARAAPRRRHPRRRGRDAPPGHRHRGVAAACCSPCRPSWSDCRSAPWLFTTIVRITDPSDGATSRRFRRG